MTPLETVKAARELISDPACWTKHSSARDSLGYPCRATDSKAVRWCLEGALFKYDGDWFHYNTLGILFNVAERLYSLSPVSANDTVGHSAALAILDAAIEELS